ncbi:putative dUTPase [red squirrel adenovirus 1]|uniref:dUTP diphosphatase n=1 Tax=red squirrel adenovirus 1 TaxID=2773314 RepID=A0A240FBG9_9ADEN|nr:putative dUTPase [red squirrel adenovirus 1]ARE31899.1 putative dUTPase [red squirrel adenovirus 1]
MATIQYTKLSSAAFDPVIPFRGYPGYELRVIADTIVKPGSSDSLRTDLSIRLPDGYFGTIEPRLGGVALGTSQGSVTVSRRYVACGESVQIMVKIDNDSADALKLRRGDVIAMLVVRKLDNTTLLRREAVSEMVEMGKVLIAEFCKVDEDSFSPIHVDSGFILRTKYALMLNPGQKQIVFTGVSFKFPESYYGALEPLDSMSWNWNVRIVAGSTVARHSRCEVKFMLENCGHRLFCLNPGDKVAYLKFQKEYGMGAVETSKEKMGVLLEPDEEIAACAPTPPPSPRRAAPDATSEGPAPKRKREQQPLIHSGIVYKIMLIFERMLPDRPTTDTLVFALEKIIREQSYSMLDCDCGGEHCRHCKEYYRRFYANCTKEISDRSLTFRLHLAGESVHFTRDGLRLSKIMEQEMEKVTNHLALKCFIKVVPVRGDFKFI